MQTLNYGYQKSDFFYIHQSGINSKTVPHKVCLTVSLIVTSIMVRGSNENARLVTLLILEQKDKLV